MFIIHFQGLQKIPRKTGKVSSQCQFASLYPPCLGSENQFALASKAFIRIHFLDKSFNNIVALNATNGKKLGSLRWQQVFGYHDRKIPSHCGNQVDCSFSFKIHPFMIKEMNIVYIIYYWSHLSSS